MTRAEIMAMWGAHGGGVHGPRVETVTMPQHLFWTFVEAVQSRATTDRPPNPRDAIEKDPTPNPKGAE